MSNTRDIHQPGLKWEHHLFGDTPTWIAEPSVEIIEKLARRELECDCNVEFLAEGAFNKVYSVQCSKGAFVFRVALPVAPKMKTLSEVATMSFVRAKTSIPVPKVIAYNADLKNELGFEWILMERINGRPLDECWDRISWLKKGLLIQKLVKFISELSELEFRGIGSLYEYQLNSRLKGITSNVEYVVGEAILPAFFVGDHIQLDVHRGPYHTSAEFVFAHTQFLLNDIQNCGEPDKKGLREDVKGAQVVYDKLQLIIPKLFPETSRERTFLSHQDLSSKNILIDDSGDIAGIIDWESLVTAPPWQAYQLPQFLNGEDDDDVPEALTEEDQQDEEKVQNHKDMLYDYEITPLRRFFLEEMGRVNPGWVETYNKEATRRDIMVAIESVDDGMRIKFVKMWLDCMLEGRKPTRTLTQAVWADPFS